MKKLYKTALFALACNFAVAQSSFFVPTTYKGAFAPAPTAMWTDNWTEWDPQNHVYPTNTVVNVTAAITTNTTWTADKTYLLQGQIFVKNGATLTIQAGTVIMGDKASNGAGLFICQGAKINAAGTAQNPIVFTSNQAAGQRASGDWGGVIIMGKASNNQPGGVAYIEGFASSPETQYGGGLTPDDNDNSGVFQYVRIEWAGYVYQPNKEINGITFGSVGKATTVDHIQVSFCNDDAFEWFGGNVDCRNLVSYRNLDDDFDTDYGFSGKVQFGLVVRDPQIADNPSVSTSEGFESDNDATGTTATPQTSAIFSNITLIGPFRGNTSNTIASGYRRGARIRRNSALKIYNSIFMDFQRGIHIDGALCEANATNNVLKFKNNIIAGNSTGKACERNGGSSFNVWAWFAANSNDSIASTTGILTTPYNYTSPDYRPANGSPALTGASFSDVAIDPYVLKAPTATTSVAYCKNATANALSATAAGNNTLNWYTVATGGTASSTAPTPSTANATTLMYYVSQTSEYNDESDRTAITVTVHDLPTATITPNGSTSFCTGGSVTLDAGNFASYLWSNNATTQTINVNATGDYSVIVTDANNCKDTSNVQSVNVSNAPLPTVTVTGNTSFCEGDSVVLTSSTADSYAWSNSATTKSITVKTSGTYYVTTTNTNACDGVGQSSSNVITVGTVPNAVGAIASTNGSVITFSNNSTGATSYLWNFGDQSSSSATAPVHAYASNGNYDIQLIAIKGMCADTAFLSQKINVGVSELSAGNSITIYPNPVRDEATFEFNFASSENVVLNIYNTQGQLVSQPYVGAMNAGINNIKVDVSQLAQGIYYANIANENAQTTLKFVVK